MKAFYIFLSLLFLAQIANAQYSSIYGKVTDSESGEELLYANIVLNKNGVFTTGGSTDFDGNYSIPVDPGTYEITISYTGYRDKIIKEVIVKAGQASKLDIHMAQGIIICCPFIPLYKVPLIEIENPTTGHTRTSEQIRRESNKNISTILQNTPGVSISNF